MNLNTLKIIEQKKLLRQQIKERKASADRSTFNQLSGIIAAPARFHRVVKPQPGKPSALEKARSKDNYLVASQYGTSFQSKTHVRRYIFQLQFSIDILPLWGNEKMRCLLNFLKPPR